MGLLRSCWQWSPLNLLFVFGVYIALQFLFAPDALHSVFILFIAKLV